MCKSSKKQYILVSEHAAHTEYSLMLSRETKRDGKTRFQITLDVRAAEPEQESV